MSLPDGVAYHEFDGERRLATRGPPAYGEPTDGDWRLWDVRRSKLGAMLAADVETGLTGGDRVLYLGAASGTTVSHVADVAGPTYAVEFAPRPARGQAAVALRNRRFLAPDGRLVMAIKARSEDVTADPETTFERVLDALREGYEVVETTRLDPTHDAHLGVVARRR